MKTQPIPTGTIHNVPDDLAEILISNSVAMATWTTITPLARNEWICLVISAKQDVTRQRRIKRAFSQLSEGKRRPCCWEGCLHRQRNGH
jgi:uncharacterized protein YdeI (YjbR/CyaY-like superfamily)